MSILFETTEINKMQLRNRFVRSATWEGMAAEDGACTHKLTELMGRLAEGGVGMIITSHAYVRQDGQAGPWQLGIYKDELINGFKEMSREVQKHGSRIVVQLAHAGFFANAKLTGQTPMAMSQAEGFAKSPRREMTAEDIQGIVESFSQAARRAKEAGSDGVQIHAAHGYLLSQSLSPVFNKRRDAYGGAVENRARLLLEVLHGVRATVGPDFPVLIKMNCQDFLEGGLTLDDSLKIGTMLREEGIDGIELSGGTFVSGKLSPSRGGIKSEDKEAYFREAAKLFKENLNVPLILVGGNRSFQLAEQLVDEGYADYISMSRPFIREPDLIKRWESGDLRNADCLSDNQCFGPAMAGEGIYCVTEKKEKRKII
ncbi:MAG: NADH:flavin oxidoreductase [Deltaproteobacteria bacterium]|nr:NADH:flavin oxidoreductase [Deltaproteobacteria bacterium]